MRAVSLGSPCWLAESRGNDVQCSIWLPESDGSQVYCVAAPSIPGFREQIGTFLIGSKGGPLGAAVHQKSPIYVSDIFNDAKWSGHLDLISSFGSRALWVRPLFSKDDQFLGSIAIHSRKPLAPTSHDLELIENVSNIACIAIERYLDEEKLRLERNRLRLLLEITNSMASRLDLRQLVETLSTDLLGVMQCDFCALLLPNADQSAFQLTTLYNPERRGILCDGMMIPNTASICGRPFRTGQAEYLENFLELEKEVASSNDSTIQSNYECLKREGFEASSRVDLC